MAVPPDYIDALTSTVAAIYREAETALVALLAKHLAGDLDTDMPAPEWAGRKLAAVRALRATAETIAAQMHTGAGQAIRDTAAAAYRSGWSSALAEIAAVHLPPEAATAAAKAVEEAPGFAAVEALANAVYADIGEKSRNVVRDVLDVYRQVVTAATGRIVTGAQTRRQAAQAAFRRLVQRGVTGFVDRAGRKWRLSSYVEMATRTVAQRAAVQGQTDRLTASGIRLVMVSNAVQECPRCRPYEGRILALPGGPIGTVTLPHRLTGKPVVIEVLMTLAAAMQLGLLHPNCRHSVSGYLVGVSRPAPQPTGDPDGHVARDRQRALERRIRAAKLDAIAALGEDAKKAAGARVRAAQATLREHLAEHPELKRLRYREQIGAGNMPPPGSADTAGDITPLDPVPLDHRDVPEPEQHEPEPVPVEEPPPPPEPGDATLARLLDPSDDLTDDAVLQLLTEGTGSDEEREDWAAAWRRFAALAEAGERDPKFARGHAKFVAKLKSTPMDGLGKYVRRRVGQLKADEQRAATLRAWWQELARRQANRSLGMRHGQRWREDGPAVEWAMKELAMPDATEHERRALVAYTGAGYSFINNGLRGWRMPDGPDEQLRFDRYVQHLDTLFAKASLDEPLIVHRGVGASFATSLGASIDDPDSMAALVRRTFVEPGFISTSIGKRAAFSGQVYVMFRVPQGYQAMNAMHLSKYGTGEREILIRRNAKYIIHAAYQRNHAWFIEAEIVEDDWEPGADWTPDPYGDAWEGYQ